MKTQPMEPSHAIARALFELRATLHATRAVLDDDTVVAQPLATMAISETRYRDEALFVGKKHAMKLAHDAFVKSLRLMELSGSRQGTELGSLAEQIAENIEAVLMRLGPPLKSACDEDRIAARRAVERPWQLSGIAIRCFFSTEPEWASKLKD